MPWVGEAVSVLAWRSGQPARGPPWKSAVRTTSRRRSPWQLHCRAHLSCTTTKEACVTMWLLTLSSLAGCVLVTDRDAPSAKLFPVTRTLQTSVNGSVINDDRCLYREICCWLLCEKRQPGIAYLSDRNCPEVCGSLSFLETVQEEGMARENPLSGSAYSAVTSSELSASMAFV
jgi:hypothetical protein